MRGPSHDQAWILSGLQDNGTPYPDYDGYTVYCPTPVCSGFTNFARQIQHLPVNYSPVADNDTVATPNSTPVTLNITNNDITYQDVPLNLKSIDLNPAVPGKQKSVTTAFGTYTLQTEGNVLFQPASNCVSGSVGTPYTIEDRLGRLSNPAKIVVTVGGIIGELYNFEDGTDTWMAASYTPGAGTVAQAAVGATSCAHSLQINATGGGFFGPAYNTTPLPLSTAVVHNLLFDITTTSVGTSQSVAVQFGSDYHYCSTPYLPQCGHVYDCDCQSSGFGDCRKLWGVGSRGHERHPRILCVLQRRRDVLPGQRSQQLRGVPEPGCGDRGVSWPLSQWECVRFNSATFVNCAPSRLRWLL